MLIKGGGSSVSISKNSDILGGKLDKDKFFALCSKRDTREAIKAISSGKIDLSWRNREGFSPLGIALLRFDQDPKLIEALIKAGYKIPECLPKNANATPLILAIIANKSCEIAEILLKNGADPNEKSGDGKTPFHMLATSDRGTEYIKVLKKYGGNPNIRDSLGKTPAWDAFFSGREAEFMKAFREAGADFDGQNPEGLTMFMAANDAEEVERLSKAGLNPNTCDFSGKTALVRGIVYEAPEEMIKAYIKAGVDPNIKDSSGRTAIFYAVQKKMKGVEKMLREAGADPSIKDNDGISAEDLLNPPKPKKDEKEG